KYAYPSRSRKFFWLHLLASVLWFVGGGMVLFVYPENLLWVDAMILGIGVYFGVFAVLDTFRGN
ncbi:MAG: hypothetical protein KDE26_24760, partial [Bacteroidetes bacterium]|nr:hypothetical protein [Bacteroidota bacterium]